ncbi:hypothetical protein ABZ934_32010 [Streptomyces sp. NPDC046557]|uniref:hypothetical protein n=1 Tax=Streptomyces sp. NPDC046557 TaxID=3155372 RepID=UPI0033F0B38F
MTQDPDQESRSEAVRSARQGTARAALGGALIGALTGLTGSVLVFVQAGRNQEAVEKARRSDVRRVAYAGVGTSFLSFKTEILGVRNFITNPNMTVDERENQYNLKYIPAYAKLQQADLTARLVASSSGKQALAKARPHREKLKDMISAAYTDEHLDGKKFTKEFDAALLKYEELVYRIMDEVDEEVL